MIPTLEAHTAETCYGLVYYEDEDLDRLFGEASKDRVEGSVPCPICAPGRYEVWKAGLLKAGWVENLEARRVYRSAAGEYPARWENGQRVRDPIRGEVGAQEPKSYEVASRGKYGSEMFR